MSELARLLGIEDSLEYQISRFRAEEMMQGVEVRQCPNGCTNYYQPGETEPFMGYGVAGCEICNRKESK